MNFLEPESDRAVRIGVDAFFEGRLRPLIAADMIFETKNSRYRLKNGHITAATDARLIGSELVGWLIEPEDTSATRMEPRWSHGARAVLLDRRLGRHIVVTSATLMLEIEGALVEGSDRRPLPPSKSSKPEMQAIRPSSSGGSPSIPKPAGVPRWDAMAVADATDPPPSGSMPPLSTPAPPSSPLSSRGPVSGPILPSTPPPRGPGLTPSTPPPASSSSHPARPLEGQKPPPGRTSSS